MTSLGTVQGLIDEGMSVTAFCDQPDCRHASELDLVAIAARLGGAFSIQRNRSWFLSRLRCAACGGPCDTIILGTDYARESAARFSSGEMRYGSGSASL